MKITTDLRVYPKEKYEFFRNTCGMIYYDTYVTAGVVGFVMGVKSTNKHNPNEEFASIPRNVLMPRSPELDYYQSLIFLSINKYNLDEKELVNKTFEDNNDSDVQYEKIEKVRLFNQYAEAGIDYLYDKIMREYNTKDFSLSDTVKDIIDELRDSVSLDQAYDIDDLLEEEEV